MNNNPLVSIITPTYNRDDFISFAIDSVLKQTYSNFELIIVDDGSTDNTGVVVKKYLNDTRIKYIWQENRGQSVARNKGLDLSTGEYVCFLDSDNVYETTKLEIQVRILNMSPVVDIVYGSEELIDEDGKLIKKKNMRCYSGVIYEKLLLDNFIGMNTTLVRRKCFVEMGGFDETIKVADDYDLWLRFSAKYVFHYEPVNFAQYRIMKNQISSDKNRRFESNKKTIQNFMDNNPLLLNVAKRRTIWSIYYVRTGRYKASIGDFDSALSDYKKALSYKILNIRLWRAYLKYITLKYL